MTASPVIPSQVPASELLSTNDLANDQAEPNLAECGWRYEEITLPDGSTDWRMVPLTEQEFLHPQEGYRLPNSTFHDRTIATIQDILTRRYQSDPSIGVFGDLVVKWDIDLGDHCPDVFVAFGMQDSDRNRTEFWVEKEGTRPTLIVEVVSPHYRKADRETKVLHYARAGVQEYVVVDRRRYRQQLLDEVLGYRLVNGIYQPISPDDDNRILCQTVGLWFSMSDGQVAIDDAQTGERLLTAHELGQCLIEEHQRAEEERQRADRLAEFLRNQGYDPDQI